MIETALGMEVKDRSEGEKSAFGSMKIRDAVRKASLCAGQSCF